MKRIAAIVSLAALCAATGAAQQIEITRNGAREIRPGDVVWTPPGMAHWHGATPTQAMSHLAIWPFVDGSGGEMMEHVSDEDYLAPAATE